MCEGLIDCILFISIFVGIVRYIVYSLIIVLDKVCVGGLRKYRYYRMGLFKGFEGLVIVDG